MSFRMETLASILPLLGPGDWAVSINLTDAYHHVFIAASFQRLLGFAFAGRCYQYRDPPLRPEARFTPLHQAGVGSGGLFQAAGYRAILLLGRLANRSRQPRARKTASIPYPAVGAGVGLPSKLGKIRTRSHPMSDLPRGRHRSPRAVGTPYRGVNRQDFGSSQSSPEVSSRDGSCVAAISGAFGQSGGCLPRLSPSHPPASDTCTPVLAPRGRVLPIRVPL